MDGCAVIVEPRKHKALRHVIQTVCRHLPEDWPLIVYYGTTNQKTMEDAVTGLEREIIKVPMKVKNLNSISYSELLMSENFWKRCVGQWVLVFQTDSIINPSSGKTIEEFLKYDYIGAPWYNGKVGNGGFSIRKKTSCLDAVRALTERDRKAVRSKKLHEDGYFVRFFNNHPGYEVAPFSVAKEFGVETVYSENPFSVHQPWSDRKKKVDLYWKLVRSDPALLELVRLNGRPTSRRQESILKAKKAKAKKAKAKKKKEREEAEKAKKKKLAALRKKPLPGLASQKYQKQSKR